MDITSKATAKRVEMESKKNQELAMQLAELEGRLKEKNPVVVEPAHPPQPPQSPEVQQLLEKLEAAVAKVDKLEQENQLIRNKSKGKGNKKKGDDGSDSSDDDGSSDSDDDPSKYLTTADGTVVSRIND